LNKDKQDVFAMILEKLQTRYKLLLPSLLVWISFFLVLHFYWLPYHLEKKKHEFFNQQTLAVQTVDEFLNDKISPWDLGVHRNLFEHIMAEHPLWRSMMIYSESGQELLQLNVSGSWSKNRNDKLINIQFTVLNYGIPAGKLKIVADSTEFLSQEKYKIYRVELILLGILSVSVFLTVFFLDSLVRAPIQDLAAAVKQMSQGDMLAKLPNRSDDEIGELVFAIRTLSNSLQLTSQEFQDELAEVVAMAAELTESEQRFRTMFNSIADTLILIDKQGMIESVNPAATGLLGYQENELIGQPVEFILPVSQKDKVDFGISVFFEAKGAGLTEGSPTETVVLSKYGKEIPVDVSLNVLRIGENDHYIGVIRDISPYKRFQESLTAEKDLAKNYLNTASVIMMAVNRLGQITLVNRKTCEVLGYTEEQLQAENWFDTLFEKTAAEELSTEFAIAMEGKTSFPEYLECHIKTKSGEEKVVVWHSNLIRDAVTGEITGLLVSGDDVTETRKNEQTSKYLQKQLQQAQKMEAVGQLTGGIAHDFNNILASIMGYSELAMLKAEQMNDEKLRLYVKNIYSSGERARDLVGKMLAFSRGKDSEKPLPLQLNAVLKELLPMLRSVIPTSVQIETQLEENLQTVLADTIDIQQIVMNLCINARDAMQGKGRIVIQTRNVSHIANVCASCHKQINGDYIELMVEDSGPGISKDKVSRLFEPFYSTKETGKGTGLGLSVIHGVVHARVGHILVDSIEGRGSRFHILFQHEKKVRKTENELISIDTELNDNTKILIIDNDVLFAGFATEMFRTNGYSVRLEKSLQIGLALFSENPKRYDLLIVDKALSEYSGLQLVNHIHSMRKNIPIILLNCAEQEFNDGSFAYSEVSAVNNKPLNSQTLLYLVEKELLKGQVINSPGCVGLNA